MLPAGHCVHDVPYNHRFKNWPNWFQTWPIHRIDKEPNQIDLQIGSVLNWSNEPSYVKHRLVCLTVCMAANRLKKIAQLHFFIGFVPNLTQP